MTSSLSDDNLKRAWQWLKVTTPYRQMLANPPQKAILIAIARNLKKEENHVSARKKRF
ncbi:hypothetical protein NB636_08125 [Oxalobacter aliiformigenes]|uniref:hypothetical protein n=1 Tax=Oxalobacter aliiformigenes TaxID=2946593 RepID=UPI0022AEE849|nr:hypothetical protein [Oxalobacter aliiformigenes]MCZ4065921.1 hypothetical protein [Oxalobacter aliiformigenes]WAV98674.1 hypothetical protein NB636_08125 [Oxalobacter aliiformigenes]